MFVLHMYRTVYISWKHDTRTVHTGYNKWIKILRKTFYVTSSKKDGTPYVWYCFILFTPLLIRQTTNRCVTDGGLIKISFILDSVSVEHTLATGDGILVHNLQNLYQQSVSYINYPGWGTADWLTHIRVGQFRTFLFYAFAGCLMVHQLVHCLKSREQFLYHERDVTIVGHTSAISANS